jgi:hypothetical protein
MRSPAPPPRRQRIRNVVVWRAYRRVVSGTSLGTTDATQSSVIDPPVTPEERLADAMSAFGLLCDRAVEYLDLLRWDAGAMGPEKGTVSE